ncbi:E3 ubiquitin-protein ligase RNF181-like [Rhodamnia argentea]|uniref:E3 ubiquitin-protein ligase RNF181-like n=1 Tax=Rhodamnia argentea TaxID=178133 RepID=A0ABM3HA24_9MYRT|nr:E3 ubiquitin-protein ligase RNF181-like [Rhodamnia argentea]
MEPVYCGYRLSLERRNSNYSGVPTAIFNFSVKWHHLLVFIDQVGVPINLQDTTLSESSQSLEMPLCILPWQSLCETHLKRVLDALDVRSSFRADLIRQEVEMEDVEAVSIEGNESDHDQVVQGVSRSTVEKLERKSCSVRDGGGCCCICLEELNGADKVMEIPCSHLFHSRCIIKWLERNNSSPLCRTKVEVEDPE